MDPTPASFSAALVGCAALPMLTGEEISDLFVAAIRHAGGTIVQMVAHAFPQVGMTSVLILAESHAVLHTWPETGTVNIDVFSCTPRLESVRAIEALGVCLGARQVSIHEIPRADGHLRGSGAGA